VAGLPASADFAPPSYDCPTCGVRCKRHSLYVRKVKFPASVLRNYDLVIAGGESDQSPHRGRPFNIRWARRLLGDCRAQGVPFFLKQIGSHPYIGDGRGDIYDDHTYFKVRDSHGGDMAEWPEDLRMREFPAA
jgi:hypothetical protein